MSVEAITEGRSRTRLPRRRAGSKFRPIVLWLVPIMGLLLVFSVLPIFASLFLSLFKYEMLQPLEFVGLGNYKYAITKDPVFHKTILNTLYYALISVPLGMAVSLLVAQLIHTKSLFKSFFRTVYFLPVVTPQIATAIVWKFIYQPAGFGFLNGILSYVGIPAQPWLTSAGLVKPALVVIGVWAGLGYNMVLFLAGLAGIPTPFYEAARIDGANSWQSFWKITWPLLSPTVLFTTVTGTISALQIFSLPFVMTKGGPENASRTIVLWIQQTGFQQFRMGYSSALAYIFFLFILILTLVELRYMKSEWSY